MLAVFEYSDNTLEQSDNPIASLTCKACFTNGWPRTCTDKMILKLVLPCI